MSKDYRPEILALNPPGRILRLPVDRGYPVPYFVAWIDGKPEFRVFDKARKKKCIDQKVCWICGEPLGTRLAFVIGPMCAINRASSEPPSHYECAYFAVRGCPFLTNPEEKRREARMPEDAHALPGFVGHNPGVILIWVTKSYGFFPAPQAELIRIGNSERVEFWSRGREATPDEVDDALSRAHYAIINSLPAGAHAGQRLTFARRITELAPFLPVKDPQT